MKRMFAVLSVAVILTITAFAQTSYASVKKDCCDSCCASKCTTDCCKSGCTSDCCDGNCTADCCK